MSLLVDREKLPSQIPMFGHVYQVRLVPLDKWTHDTSIEGFCDYNRMTIEIRSDLCDSRRWQAFWHEVIHAALGLMNRHELNENEEFVDVLGGLIHQAISGAKHG